MAKIPVVAPRPARILNNSPLLLAQTQTGTTTLEHSFAVHTKKHTLTIGSRSRALRYASQMIFKAFTNRNLHMDAGSSLFQNRLKLEAAYPSVGEQINKL